MSASYEDIEREGKARRKRAHNLLVQAQGSAQHLVELAKKNPALCDAMFTYGDRRQKRAAQKAISELAKRKP